MISKLVKNYIAKNKLEYAIRTLMANSNIISNYYNDVIIQSKKLYEIQEHKRNGTLSIEQIQINESRIAKTLLEISELIKKKNHIPTSFINQKKQQVEIILDGDITEYDDAMKKEIITYLSNILKIDEHLISIKRVIEGSIKLHVELPEEKAKELIRLIEENKISLIPPSNKILAVSTISRNTRIGYSLRAVYFELKDILKNQFKFIFFVIISLSIPFIYFNSYYTPSNSDLIDRLTRDGKLSINRMLDYKYLQPNDINFFLRHEDSVSISLNELKSSLGNLQKELNFLKSSSQHSLLIGQSYIDSLRRSKRKKNWYSKEFHLTSAEIDAYYLHFNIEVILREIKKVQQTINKLDKQILAQNIKTESKEIYFAQRTKFIDEVQKIIDFAKEDCQTNTNIAFCNIITNLEEKNKMLLEEFN